MEPTPPALPGKSPTDRPSEPSTVRGGVRVAHLLLIVAAVAFGIVGVRVVDLHMRQGQYDRRNLVNAFVLASPMLVALSAALAVARLLPPRPRLAETFRRPGFAACWIPVLSVGAGAVKLSLMNLDKFSDLDKFISLFNFALFYPYAVECGGGVLVAWLTLALSGAWRADTGWIDRAGRALGVAYIGAYLANGVSWLLWLP